MIQRRLTYQKPRAASTIVELLTVIAIIVTLLGLSLAGLSAARSSARDNRRIADIRVIQTSLELYALNEGADASYPDNYPYPIAYVEPSVSTTGVTGNGIYQNGLFLKYLATTPVDPRKLPYVYFGPGCLHEGTGTVSDPSIVSPASSAGQPLKILSPSEIKTTTGNYPESNYCPDGAGWMPYLLYVRLERGKRVAVSPGIERALAQRHASQFDDHDQKNPLSAVYGPQPIFRDDGTIQSYIPGLSYCVPESATKSSCPELPPPQSAPLASPCVSQSLLGRKLSSLWRVQPIRAVALAAIPRTPVNTPCP